MTTSTRESRALSGEIFLKIRIWKNDNKLSSQVLKDSFLVFFKRIQIEEGEKDHHCQKGLWTKVS